MVPKEICWSKLAPLWRTRYTKISFFVLFWTTSNGGALVYPRQRKLVRSSTFRREFIPFVGLILIVLAILAYYLGKTQYITIRGKHPKVWVQKKKNSLFPEFGFTRESPEIVIEKNGKLKLNWAATSIMRPRPPFGRRKIQSKIDDDDRLWTNKGFSSRAFFFKVMFLLKIMLIYDKPLAGTLRVAA